jgi:hypothetical protein
MLVAEIAPGFTSGFISGAPVPLTVLKRRNIVGVLAFVERPEPLVGRINRLLDLGRRLCA